MKVLMAGAPASGNKWLRQLFKKVTKVKEITGLTDYAEQEELILRIKMQAGSA